MSEFSRRRFLESVVGGFAGIGSLVSLEETDAGRAVNEYLFGEDEAGFKPIEEESHFERVFAAYDEIDPRLRNNSAIDELPEINGDGSIYVLGKFDNPLGVAYVDTFNGPEHFLEEGHLAKSIAGYRSFRDRIFDGWKGGDVIEVVPTSFYNQGLDGVAGDLGNVDLSRSSSNVLRTMANQARELDGEYTFIRVPIRDAFRVHTSSPSSAGAIGSDSMLLVYDKNNDGASYDAIVFRK